MNFGASANVDAAGGLIDNQYFWFSSQPFRDNDLLLVTTRKIAGQLPDSRRLNSQIGNVFFRQPVLRPEVEERALGEFPQSGEPDILANCHGGQQTLSLPVFGNVGDAEFDRLFRAPNVDVLTIQFDRTGFRRGDPENRLSKFSPAGSDQAGHAHNFSRSKLDTGIFE